jgi:hypothetical protein
LSALPLCPRFAGACFNTPHTVLRRQLRPFSLWHRLYLRAENNPLLTGEDVRPQHLEIAVRICETGYLHTYDPRPRKWWLLWKLRGINLGEEFAKFSRYVESHCHPPEFEVWTHGKEGPKRGKMPEELATAIAAAEAANCPIREAWEMPIGLAHWYAAATYSKIADLDFTDPKTTAWRQHLREKFRTQHSAIQTSPSKG